MLHELGHYLGLGHGTADKDPSNVMYKIFQLGTMLYEHSLENDQIREMHDRLANHHTRRDERID